MHFLKISQIKAQASTIPEHFLEPDLLTLMFPVASLTNLWNKLSWAGAGIICDLSTTQFKLKLFLVLSWYASGELNDVIGKLFPFLLGFSSFFWPCSPSFLVFLDHLFVIFKWLGFGGILGLISPPFCAVMLSDWTVNFNTSELGFDKWFEFPFSLRVFLKSVWEYL